MVKLITIDDSWSNKIVDVATRFNAYVKKHSLRMISFLIDKAFDILSDDKDVDQYDAAKFLNSVRSVNPELVGTYINTLIDAKVGKFYFESEDYVTPDHLKFPVSTISGEDDITFSAPQAQNTQNPPEVNLPEVVIEEEIKDMNEGDEITNIQSELVNWGLFELIKYKVVKNLTKITYDEIKSSLNLNKCACGDGVFDKKETDIWACTECGAPYHENCAKVVSLFETECRICGKLLLLEDPKVLGEDEKKDTDAEN